MNLINVYLVFDGNCREALTFYRDCFGGELEMQTVAESPMASEWPAEVQAHILHASLVNESLKLFGSDMGDADGLIEGNTVALSLNTTSKKQLNQFFNKLSEGGEVLRPLHSFFAGTMGALNDKYNKKWLLYCDNTQD
jgi:PhnB protein